MDNNDNLYEKLVFFRDHYPSREIKHNGIAWKYHISSKGNQPLLLLPGGMGNGEAFFAHFLELLDRYTVIVPYYGRAVSMQQINEGLMAILSHEQINGCYIFGQSFGGIVAQSFQDEYPQMATKTILSHTTTILPTMNLAMSERRVQKIQKAIKLVHIIPKPLLTWLSGIKINRHLKHMSTEDLIFWKGYFKELMAKQSIDELIAMYHCMIDYMQHSRPQSESTNRSIPMLILDSPTDMAFSDEERLAVRLQYPNAIHHSFASAGHIGIITQKEIYMKEIFHFLES
jgi:pimeloyl-ACP methyl ester carboxylesterase